MGKFEVVVALVAGCMPLLRGCASNSKSKGNGHMRSAAQIRAHVIWRSIDAETMERTV